MSQSLTLPSGMAHPSRLRPASGLPVTIPLWEIAVLTVSGVLAATAVGLIELRLRIPGHSILHAVLPMALGLALAPRRFAGTGMSLAAIATAFGLMKTGHGEFGAGAWTSLACLGPSLDLMLGTRWGQRWPAFSVSVAGLLANGCAFVAKAIEKTSKVVPPLRGPGMGGGGGNGMGGGGGMGMGGGRGLGGGAGMGRTWDEWISVAPVSYVICGLLAGLVCGVALFHLRQRVEARSSGASTSPQVDG